MDKNRHFQKNTFKKNENERNNFNMRPAGNRIGLLVLFLLGAFFIVMAMMNKETNVYPVISYSDFLTAVGQNQVSDVQIQDQKIILGTMRSSNISDGGQSRFQTVIPYNDTSLMSFLEQNGVQVSGKATKPNILSEVLNFLPLFILLIFLFVFMRQMSMQNSRGMQFGRSRARLFDTNKKKVTFADVAGQEEAKKELSEIVDFLKNPKKYREIGAKIPGGVLLVGSPGTGKTLLARAVAGEAGVPFFRISGSDFVEMFVGVGASRVRDLFKQARDKAPCIVFIDELDAIGKSRINSVSGGNDEREQTLNQLLVEMDGFDNEKGLIILAATNRPDILDPALLRPGRFDRQVPVERPDVKGREEILRIHSKNVKLDGEVNFESLAHGTIGFSGADLANVVNEAALLAVRNGHAKVLMSDFNDAIDKVSIGLKKKTRKENEKERRIVAFHETGHALVGAFTPGYPPVNKITVVPRSHGVGGFTQYREEEEKTLQTERDLINEVDVLLGGRAAEQVVFNEISTGAANDIQRATDTIRKMITAYGMSGRFKNVTLGKSGQGYGFGPAEPQLVREYSEETQKYIDEEIARIMAERFKHVLSLLKEKKRVMEYIANRLLEKETIEQQEFNDIIKAEADLAAKSAQAKPRRGKKTDEA